MKKGTYKILTFISSITLCMSFFIVSVKAESDIYYPDPSSYTCYNYFFNNGYTHLMLSTSSNVTYNVNLDNRGSNDGTITGTDGLSGSSHNTGTINSNGSSTLGAKYMVCSTNNGTSASQTYSCYFSNRQNGVSNSQSINIGFNENTYSNYNDVDINVNETIKQDINTDITGSITSSNSSSHYTYLPWLKGNYNSGTGYEFDKRLWLDEIHNNIYMIFFTQSRIRNLDKSGVRIVSDTNGNATWQYVLDDIVLSGLYLNIFHIIRTSGQGNVSINFYNLTNQDVLPIYYGDFDSMPDDVAIMARLRKSTGMLLSEGNDYTNDIVSNANDANNQVSQKIGQFDNIENNSVNDMNSKISNLNLTSDILSNSKFLSSAQWVKTQFDRMTVSTPIGSVLSFSLILGMTLIFLGKIK